MDAHRLLHLAADAGLQAALLERLYRAHFTELRSIYDRESLVALATDVGIPSVEAARVLDDRVAYHDRVAADEALARSLGISGVPFFVIDRTYGVSGAQPIEAFTRALEKVWAASHPVQMVAGGAPTCDDGICY